MADIMPLSDTQRRRLARYYFSVRARSFSDVALFMNIGGPAVDTEEILPLWAAIHADLTDLMHQAHAEEAAELEMLPSDFRGPTPY